jgi:hypothetical protein
MLAIESTARKRGAADTVAKADACEVFPLRSEHSRLDMLFCAQLLPSTKA